MRFVDFRSGQIRQGKLIARQPEAGTVLEHGMRRTWKLPYVAIAPAEPSHKDGPRIYEPPP